MSNSVLGQHSFTDTIWRLKMETQAKPGGKLYFLPLILFANSFDLSVSLVTHLQKQNKNAYLSESL